MILETSRDKRCTSPTSNITTNTPYIQILQGHDCRDGLPGPPGPAGPPGRDGSNGKKGDKGKEDPQDQEMGCGLYKMGSNNLSYNQRYRNTLQRKSCREFF